MEATIVLNLRIFTWLKMATKIRTVMVVRRCWWIWWCLRVKGLDHLRLLRLDDNRLRRINADTFRSTAQLTELDLGENRLSGLDNGTFVPLTQLGQLSIDGNRFKVSVGGSRNLCKGAVPPVSSPSFPLPSISLFPFLLRTRSSEPARTSGKRCGRIWCTLKLSESHWSQSFRIFWVPCFTVERSKFSFS